MRIKLLPRHALPLLAILTATLTGCVSDDEKIVGFEEQLATAVDTNKNDCEAMAKALTTLADAKGKEMQRLKRKVAGTKEDKAALNARLDAKFGPRRKATRAKMIGGAKCLMSSDSVATAMMLLEGDGEGQPDRTPPPKPVTGAPVAFVVEKVAPGSLSVSAYNFGDKKLAGYNLVIRYYDAAGKAIRVSKIIDRDFDTWSISGTAYALPAKQWRRFELDHLQTPSDAVKAEVLATAARALEGARIAMEPAWQYEGNAVTAWPGAASAK